jgi:acyl-CoA synthetase (AMP-forming)/AMP-acid ligase II
MIDSDWQAMSVYILSMFRARMRERNDRISLFYTLEERAQDKKYADAIYLLFEGRQWTYKQVYETALKYGTWLKATFNVKPKDIVAMNFENSEKFCFMWLGLWAIGARPAFLNYNLTGKALAHCIRVSTARIVIVDINLQDRVNDELREQLPGVEFAIFTPELEAAASTIDAVREPNSSLHVDKLSDMAILIYTSGTTGLPKPAIVSWMKCSISSMFPNLWMGFKRPDIFYSVCPLFSYPESLTSPTNNPSPCLSTTPPPPSSGS